MMECQNPFADKIIDPNDPERFRELFLRPGKNSTQLLASLDNLSEEDLEKLRKEIEAMPDLFDAWRHSILIQGKDGRTWSISVWLIPSDGYSSHVMVHRVSDRELGKYDMGEQFFHASPGTLARINELKSPFRFLAPVSGRVEHTKAWLLSLFQSLISRSGHFYVPEKKSEDDNPYRSPCS